MEQTVEEVEAEIAKQQKKLMFLKERQKAKFFVRNRIHQLLEDNNLTIEEVYDDLIPQSVGTSGFRKRGTPKFRGPSGQTYDGRGARRADEFAEFLIDEHLDVQSIADAGLLNPEWMMQRRNRMPLARLGVTDVEEYLEKHQLRIEEPEAELEAQAQLNLAK